LAYRPGQFRGGVEPVEDDVEEEEKILETYDH